MKWSDWTTGKKGWALGALSPDEVLYAFDGPAIFTCQIGLENYLFYKSDEHDEGDYFIAAGISIDELAAMKAGKLSVRGAFSQKSCWLLDVDLDLKVRRYEQQRSDDVSQLLPRPGIALRSSQKGAADSIDQVESPLAFKFYGDELTDRRMPLSTFRGLIDSVYHVVRRSLVPPSLSVGRDSEVIDFPIRPPQFASLLIAIEHPFVDETRLRSRERTKNMTAQELRAESEAEGVKFISQVERTVDVASSGKITKGFARENIHVLDAISEIIPDNDGDVSKLQLSSAFHGATTFIEVNRDLGERIHTARKSVRDRTTTINGVVVGLVQKSRTFLLRNRYGREVTCYVARPIYDRMLAAGEISVGRRLRVNGEFYQRDFRDLLKVEGTPTLL